MTTIATPSEHELKPEDWQYFAEGAANMILKSDLPRYGGKLLRVRKYVPGSPSTVLVNDFYQKHVVPVLKETYVSSQLVNLSEGFVHAINIRPPAKKQRNDAKLDEDETHAFLMESAFDSSLTITSHKIKACSITLCNSPSGKLEEVVVEFKPKWLLLSPNSGENSIRCRTCALAYMRGKKPGICPLDLVSEDYKVVHAAFEQNLKGSEEFVSSEFPLSDVISKALYKSEVFEKLKRLQAMDVRGIARYSNDEDLDENFLVATAARDCTMFVSVRIGSTPAKNSDKIVTVGETDYIVSLKLADIDLKNPSQAKRDYWLGIERSLIDDKWYYKKEIPVCRALA